MKIPFRFKILYIFIAYFMLLSKNCSRVQDTSFNVQDPNDSSSQEIAEPEDAKTTLEKLKTKEFDQISIDEWGSIINNLETSLEKENLNEQDQKALKDIIEEANKIKFGKILNELNTNLNTGTSKSASEDAEDGVESEQVDDTSKIKDEIAELVKQLDELVDSEDSDNDSLDLLLEQLKGKLLKLDIKGEEPKLRQDCASLIKKIEDKKQAANESKNSEDINSHLDSIKSFKNKVWNVYYEWSCLLNGKIGTYISETLEDLDTSLASIDKAKALVDNLDNELNTMPVDDPRYSRKFFFFKSKVEKLRENIKASKKAHYEVKKTRQEIEDVIKEINELNQNIDVHVENIKIAKAQLEKIKNEVSKNAEKTKSTIKSGIKINEAEYDNLTMQRSKKLADLTSSKFKDYKKRLKNALEAYKKLYEQASKDTTDTTGTTDKLDVDNTKLKADINSLLNNLKK
jgi:DNA repair exonuclease SbcCD ATPase subunit